ncbi:oxidoreductase [Streptomyces sp. NBC_01744]|nr:MULTISPECIES: oxidoreductase [unclassified Streptomyces]WSF81858.1 oxidoreductase [Streptomyces sp. NBC_01744]WSC51022.1 oxidoreductase [Streptomyces sp. NBC_01761]WSC58499.1 oxidoreductase [Streptomyces sp. NBC_01761]WSF89607.1 oxidoreductase [Streptomyces sp. NBC_01744]WSJ48331.1 oxidoreductase [Streptomyces sp. NBC_01318]
MTTDSRHSASKPDGGGWTADRMAEQKGRTFVVTGATSGLGLVTARELAAHGGRVLLAVRDAARGKDVASSLRRAYPGAEVEVRRVDLLNLDSIRRAAEEIGGEESVDVLVNNAGISMVEHSVTAQGAERHLAANHLGHFALTALLEPALRRSPAPRVVTVTSYLHEKGELDLDDVAWSRKYTPLAAYSASKLANAVFGAELARRERSSSSPITSILAHPGYSNTPMQSKGNGIMGIAMRVSGKLFAQSPEMGALPQLFAATEPDLAGGTYIGPDGRGGRSGHPRPVRLSAAAQDPELGRRLWERSQQLTGGPWHTAEV